MLYYIQLCRSSAAWHIRARIVKTAANLHSRNISIMSKRKAAHVEAAEEPQPLRRSARYSGALVVPPKPAVSRKASASSKASRGETEKSGTTKSRKREPESGASAPAGRQNVPDPNKAKPKAARSKKSAPSQAVQKAPATFRSSQAHQHDHHDPHDRQFWLMKAEPESRFENGHDISFSISALRACTDPEPWDGIRNYAARNNMRTMRKGDLAFFYHSNCKNPGIAGVMEIVGEATPDWSAQDPSAAYYDPKDKDKENPRWSIVHVEFRQEFGDVVGLKELKAWGEGDGPLKGMHLLRMSRLSVSRVSREEWEFIMRVVEEREEKA